MSHTWAMGPRVCSSCSSVPYARLERTPMRSSNPRHGRLCAPEWQPRRGKSRLDSRTPRGFERRPPRGEKSELTAHAHAGDRSRGAVVIRLLSTTFTRRRGPSKRPRRARRSIASRRRAEREHIREVGLPQVRSSADPPTIFSLSCPRSSARPCTPAVCRAPTRPSRGEDDDYVFSVVFEQVRQCHVRSFETNLKR